MNRSIRAFLRLTICIGIFLGSFSSSQAHYLWLKASPGDEQAEAVLFFGADVSDEAYHLPESLAAAKIWRRKMDGQRAEVPSKKVETDDRIGLVAPLADDQPCVLETTQQYGVYEDWLLTYYAKHIACASNDQLAKAGPSPQLRLDVVPRALEPSPQPSPGGRGSELELTVLWDGKPLPGAEVAYAIGDAEVVNKTAGQDGKVVLQPEGDGLVAVLTHFNDDTIQGKLDGQAYSTAAHYATLTFPWRSAKQAAEPSPIGRGQGEGLSAHPASTEQGSIPPLPDGLASFGAAVADGWLYVYGGHTGTAHDHSAANLSGHFRRIQLDDGEAWEELSMQIPVQGLALVAHEGRLYRVGGMNARNATPEDDEDLHSTSDFACFDPDTRQWTDLAPLPAPRSSHDAVVIGDKLYVVGGWTLNGSGDEGEWLDRTLVYDLARPEDGWQALPKQTFQRRALAAAHWHGKLVALGGMDADQEVSQRVDFYDPNSRQWSAGPDLPGEDMAGFGVSAWNLDGDLYVCGMQGVVYQLSAEGSAWEEVAQLAKPRFFHRLLPGGGGALVVVGGASEEEGHLAGSEWIKVKPRAEQPLGAAAASPSGRS